MRRGGRVAEGSGLLNRRRVNPLPRVQIPPSPPFFYADPDWDFLGGI